MLAPSNRVHQKTTVRSHLGHSPNKITQNLQSNASTLTADETHHALFEVGGRSVGLEGSCLTEMNC